MKSTLGFYGGYNFQIEPDGTIGQYRKVGEETIGATGYNFDSIHICLSGNFDIELPTTEQKQALKKLLEKYIKEFNIPPQNIFPHRKVANKSCYGLKLSDSWARDLIQDNQKILDQLLAQIIWLQSEISKLLKLRK